MHANNATAIPVRQGIPVLYGQILNIAAAAPLLWITLLVAAVAALVMIRVGRAQLFLALFLVTSFATCCPGFYFRRHYFIPLLAALALSLGQVAQWTFRRYRHNRLVLAFGVFLFLAATLQSIYQQRVLFFELSPELACRAIYGANPFPEAIQIGRYIREHTPETRTVAVIGSEPEIYFYARRRSCTGYIYTYPLMAAQPYASTMQKEMISEIEQAKPDVVVLVNVATSWLNTPASDATILKWASSYTKRMTPQFLVDMESAERTQYYEAAAASRRPLAENHIVAYVSLEND